MSLSLSRKKGLDNTYLKPTVNKLLCWQFLYPSQAENLLKLLSELSLVLSTSPNFRHGEACDVLQTFSGIIEFVLVDDKCHEEPCCIRSLAMAGATHWCKQRGPWLKIEWAGVSQELLSLCHGEGASSQQVLDGEVSRQGG